MNDSVFLDAVQLPIPEEEQRRGQRNHVLPVRLSKDFDLSDGRRKPKQLPAEVNVTKIKVPRTFKEAVSGEDAACWVEAIQAELEAHRRNGTWKVVTKPKDKRRINSNWGFRVQEHKIGGGSKFRARLVAGGHLQRQGEDFYQTFACVSRYETVRVIIAWAVQEQLFIRQFDAETAFMVC